MACTVLIRHGTTTWNDQGRLQGWSDASLTPAGRREAASAAALASEAGEPRRIVTSPLSRAVETAEIVAERTDTELIEVESGWRERSFGSLEGESAKAAFETHPELHPKSAAFSARASLDGESTWTVIERVRQCWRSIRRADEPLVVVTHETPLRIVTGLIDGIDPIEAIRQRSFTPGSAITVDGVRRSAKSGPRWTELSTDG